MTGPIVVGIDGREPPQVLDFAAALAGRLETALVLVHAAGEPLPFPYADVRMHELVRREAMTEGERLLADAGAGVRESVGETRVEFGEPPEVLRRVADELDASLIVVSPRQRRRLSRVLSRGTSGALAASGPAPVVIVPREMRRVDGGLAGGPIVVGSDGSAEGARAAVVAEALSDRLELPVLPVGIDIADEAARGALRYRHGHGRPGEALAEIARRVRGALLVVGTAGGGWLSGSVAQRLIGSAPVPLVVVPKGEQHA